MDISAFENRRWKGMQQPHAFRHTAALSLIDEGPVLDLGSGDGLLLELLRERGIRASGLDISVEGVAKTLAKGLEAKQHSFDEPIPYPDASFKVAVLLDVLEHVYEPLELLKEASRVADVVIVSVPNFSSLPARLQTLCGRVPENNSPHKGHLYWFNYYVLETLARRAGLRIEALAMNTFTPFSYLGPSCAALRPNLLALSFVAKLRKESFI